MPENIMLISLFPTQAVENEQLAQMLKVFEAESKLVPEKWGNDERIRKAYDEIEIQELVKEGVQEGSRRFDDIYLHRTKKLRYSGRFSTRLHPRSYLKFTSRDKAKEAEKKMFFELGDRMAQLTKPKFGVSHILFADSIEMDNTIEYELMEECGQPTPARFLPYGPLGVGLRTYFGEQLIKCFEREFLLKAPAYVEELDWGGIRIDLIEEPWKIDQDTLLKKWLEVMAYLDKKNAFAKYKVRDDGSLAVAPIASKVWLESNK